MRKLALAAALLGALPFLAHRRTPVAASGIRRFGHHVRGSVHVHTARSHDGRGSLRTVVRAARAASLDFVVITDHNTDAPSDWPGRHEGVLVITGQEKATDAGHALVLGIPRLPYRLDGDPREVARDVRDLGGFVVAAHPSSSHSESRWSAGLDGVAGVEVVNFAEPEAWPRDTPSRLLALSSYAVDPRGALLRSFRFDRAALDLFDAGLAERPLAAVLGSDAHGGLDVGPVSLPIPAHARVFGLAAQHLLLADAPGADDARDARAVLDALRGGRGWVALDGLADASGFAFEAESGGRRASMGEGLALSGEATLRAEANAPAGTRLVLLRNGRPLSSGARIEEVVRDPGAYRVEAYLDPQLVPGGAEVPWILSNAISVFPEEELRARDERARARLDEPSLEALSLETIDRFDGAPLRPEWQVDARAEGARLSWEAGTLRFDFTLGPGPRTHASFCEWRERDLSGAKGLLLRVRASRPLRFDVQVRVADAAPGGVRVWRRSVRASPDWEERSVRFAALKSYDARGGEPDLSRVRGIYVHVDESNLEPGQGGTLWLDDVRIAR